MKVVLSGEALADLDGIAVHIARDNPTRALSYVKTLRTAARGLSRFPRRFPPALGVWQGDVRRRVHGNYLIVYRVEMNKVTVLRFLHGARDYETLGFAGE